MDKIARIRQKIKEIKELLEDHDYYLDNSERAFGYGLALVDIEQFLDIISKEPDKSLEEAAEEFAEGEWDGVAVDTDGNPLYAQDEIEYAFKAGAEWQAEKCDEETSKLLYAERQTAYINGWDDHKEDMLKDSVTVECYVRVYPTLDDKPRPWVALYKHGIGCNSLRDIPELENIGFKDNDTAIVIIKRKEDGQ